MNAKRPLLVSPYFMTDFLKIISRNMFRIGSFPWNARIIANPCNLHRILPNLSAYSIYKIVSDIRVFHQFQAIIVFERIQRRNRPVFGNQCRHIILAHNVLLYSPYVLLTPPTQPDDSSDEFLSPHSRNAASHCGYTSFRCPRSIRLPLLQSDPKHLHRSKTLHR